MRLVIAALVLTGVSFVIWGLLGLCRSLYECDRQTRRRFSYLLSISWVAYVGVAALVLVSHVPLVWLAEQVGPLLALDDQAATVATWAARGWLVACGTMALYAGLRLFRVERLGLALVVFAGLGSLILEAIALGISSPPLPFSELPGSIAGRFGLAAAIATTAVAATWIHRHTHGAVDEPETGPRLTIADVAIVVCAHNEEEVIGKCLARARELVPESQIFVASDGSSDGTVEIARGARVNVLDIQPNGGKARALAEVIERFGIVERFEAVLILDADAEVDEHYVERALPLLDDPEVVAVAGHANPKWYQHWLPRWSMFFAAYRVRLYTLTQALLRYGQTWGHTNVTFIVPGFASMYRTRVLPQIDIAAPGLSVEDFNMTFEIHRKRLGRIAYTPEVSSTSQEAHSLGDYAKQVRRWYLGFWQTVRRHGIWPSFFWASLGAFVLEMLIASVVFVGVPVVVALLVIEGAPVQLWLPTLGVVDVGGFDLLIAVLLADYTLTLMVAIAEKKPVLLVYGVGFLALRWLDAILFLYTLPLAFVENSDGRWQSPQRLLGPGPATR